MIKDRRHNLIRRWLIIVGAGILSFWLIYCLLNWTIPMVSEIKLTSWWNYKLFIPLPRPLLDLFFGVGWMLIALWLMTKDWKPPDEDGYTTRHKRQVIFAGIATGILASLASIAFSLIFSLCLRRGFKLDVFTAVTFGGVNSFVLLIISLVLLYFLMARKLNFSDILLLLICANLGIFLFVGLVSNPIFGLIIMVSVFLTNLLISIPTLGLGILAKHLIKSLIIPPIMAIRTKIKRLPATHIYIRAWEWLHGY